MPDFRVLILEDDESWLARHERRLRQAGFADDRIITTQVAKEAIQICKTDPTIKFVIVDHILYVPPIPPEGQEGELQRWQGDGVIREVTAQRADIRFVFVSSYPQRESNNDLRLFVRKTAWLKEQNSVIDVIHKLDIEDNPDRAYRRLLAHLQRPQTATKAEVITPKILIGLGFTIEEHEAMAEQMEIRRRSFLPVAHLLEKAGSARAKLLHNLWDRAKEKAVFLEMPDDRRPNRLTDIRPDSKDFEILAFLAQQTEQKIEIIIRDKDYKHATRKLRKKVDAVTVYDAMERQDFAFEHAEGRKRLRYGVQMEGKAEHNSPLKVAIHRLRKTLQTFNLGPARQIFTFDQDGYRPSFELGIVLYAVRAAKTASAKEP